MVEGNYASIIAHYLADVHARGKDNVGFKLLGPATYRRMLDVLPARYAKSMRGLGKCLTLYCSPVKQ